MPDSRFVIIRSMRTTIDIPDVLYKSVKSRCATMGTTMRHVTIALYGNWMQNPEWMPHVKTEYVMADAQNAATAEHRPTLSCFGIVKPRAHIDGPHDMASIRKGIAQGLKKEYAGLKKRRGFV